MHPKNFRKLALICALSGLALLYFISAYIGTPTVDIETITMDSIGTTVKVCGEITSRRTSNNHLFFDIRDQTGEISLVVFNSTALSLKESGRNLYQLKSGDQICFTGEVDEWPQGSGQLELKYKKIKIKDE